MAASVSSLDKDLRKLRLDKYTPAAANEVKEWIEEIFGERLPPGDLLESLKDGVALCKLVNLAIPPPGVKVKQSSMPFVQMENISLFLRACKSPPLNMQDHDVFLTVDLYEQKDPTQVLQCLGSFSRVAHNVKPLAFPSPIGPKRGSVVSPQSTGPSTPTSRDRGLSSVSNTSSAFGGQRPVMAAHKTGDSGSGRWSPTKNQSKDPSSPVSSWSKRDQEGKTSPAWNIAQYGYMGGASQGNLGIAFGGRRQITSAGPHVPNLAEKERRRKQREAEEERQRLQAEEEERQRKAVLEAEEARAREEEERRWEKETQRAHEEERSKAEEEKRRWEEEERQWKLTEEKRRQEEQEAEARLEKERSRTRSRSDARLRGQFLSQYQAEQNHGQPQGLKPQKTGDERIRELERELELARERERQYELERQERAGRPQPDRDAKVRARSRSRPAAASPPNRQDSYTRGEREILQTYWDQRQQGQGQGQGRDEAAASPPQPATSPRPLPDPTSAPAPQKLKSQNTGGSSRPLPDPTAAQKVQSHNTGGSSRPLPNPASYASPPGASASSSSSPFSRSPFSQQQQQQQQQSQQEVAPPPQNRTDKFLSSNPAPRKTSPQPTYPRELGVTAEHDAEDRRRAQSQNKTKAGGWASKSLLEREMEMERQRQQEWEEAQKETAAMAAEREQSGAGGGDDGGVDGIGGGIGGRWDVGQWSGFTGGDNQNKGGAGIGSGRRQIVGPRPLPGSNKRGP